MDVILIPGFWLDASSWERVVPIVEQAGHRAHPVTLPGLESRDADRSGIRLRDHVAHVVDLVDRLAGAGKVALVGHSGGGAVAHATVDARPDKVARVVYLASEPLGDGQCVNDELPVENGEVPLPEWSVFPGEMTAGLDDALRADFRARAVPTPAGAARDDQRLTDERRYDVPVTVIACEYPTAMLQQWIAEGEPGAAELGLIKHVDYVDLPTGHWPQLTRPEDAGRLIAEALAG
jgi:pimeloyl-ACP methyl ester carboxylesterase